MLRKLKNLFHLFESVISAVFYKFPGKKLTVIGVTGTDGKTTTATLIHHILTVAGFKTALLSTLSSAHMTTPGRWRVQKFLRQSLDNKCTHVVMEVTSIAIDQHRIWGIDFAIGALTNIANNEHLDYHQTFEKYKNTKLCFLSSCRQKVMGPDLDQADFQKILAVSKLPGNYNDRNIMVAVATVRLLGIDENLIVKAVSTFRLPVGRFEIVHRKPLVIVDFAHTPQAFENVLPEAKKACLPTGRLNHVFGCTGNRDRGKRPIMGEIAAKLDDYIILTSEDTYLEDPEKIISEIRPGLDKAGYQNFEVIPDRKAAIKRALELARTSDVVILTGVGHQRSMNIAGHEIPWNEPKIVKELLSNKNYVGNAH